MSKREPSVLLDDIRISIEKIQRYTAGLDEASFLADEKTIDAVVRNLEIIGEVAKQLPAEFKKRHPAIAWTQIAGLRNRIVHAFQTSFRSIPAQSFCKQRFRSWRFRSPSWNNEHCGGSRNSNHLRFILEALATRRRL